jgi:hypothetical protein
MLYFGKLRCVIWCNCVYISDYCAAPTFKVEISVLMYQTNTRRHVPEGSSLHGRSENAASHKGKQNQCRGKSSRISMLRRWQTSCNFAGLLEGSFDTGTAVDVPISTAYRRQARSLHCQRDRLLDRRAETGGTVL